jgi:hypothetical protein
MARDPTLSSSGGARAAIRPTQSAIGDECASRPRASRRSSPSRSLPRRATWAPFRCTAPRPGCNGGMRRGRAPDRERRRRSTRAPMPPRMSLRTEPRPGRNGSRRVPRSHHVTGRDGCLAARIAVATLRLAAEARESASGLILQGHEALVYATRGNVRRGCHLGFDSRELHCLRPGDLTAAAGRSPRGSGRGCAPRRAPGRRPRRRRCPRGTSWSRRRSARRRRTGSSSPGS